MRIVLFLAAVFLNPTNPGKRTNEKAPYDFASSLAELNNSAFGCPRKGLERKGPRSFERALEPDINVSRFYNPQQITNLKIRFARRFSKVSVWVTVGRKNVATSKTI